MVDALYEPPEVTHQKVAEALTPLPQTAFYTDEEDDQRAFERATAQASAHQRAEKHLAELRASPDPRGYWSGLVLRDAHEHLKALGILDKSARAASTPEAFPYRTLADAIWHGRNQNEHYVDGEDFAKETAQFWEDLLGHAPAAFNLSAPPADRAAVQSHIRQKSWARELLDFLGWDSRDSILREVQRITP